MIVIDKRDDPLIVIRIEAPVTVEDLYRYQQLRDEYEAQHISYAIVWQDDALWMRTAPHLHTQAESSPVQTDALSSMSFFRMWRTALAWMWMLA